jgi:hypothetical protein
MEKGMVVFIYRILCVLFYVLGFHQIYLGSVSIEIRWICMHFSLGVVAMFVSFLFGALTEKRD